MSHRMGLLEYGVFARGVVRNPAPALLYEQALQFDEGVITSSGALATNSHAKTGRSPRDKRLVDTPAVHDEVWWGSVNIPMRESSFRTNRQRAIDYLERCQRIYVI